MVAPENLQYLIAISLIPGIGCITARSLIAYLGQAERVFRESEKSLMRIPGIGEINAQRIVTARNEALARAEAELQFIEQNKLQYFVYTETDYPARLKNCSDAPLVLFFKGSCSLNEPKVLSVVGTRNATNYGKQVCDELIGALAQRGYPVVVVSGLAYGIDIQIHKACLKHDIPTVGVLGHGLDQLYPSQHKPIAAKMIENGGLLTDFVSGSKIDRQNFLRRNRIIAGLADATVIVESAEKGGALVTADIANSYNRDVFAFPGRCNDLYSRGCNKIIKLNEAALVENLEDIERAMGWNIATKAPQVWQPCLFSDLTPEEEQIVETLRSGQRFVDELSQSVELPVSRVSSILLGLEFKGIVASLPGKVYALR